MYALFRMSAKMEITVNFKIKGRNDYEMDGIERAPRELSEIL